MKHSNETKEKLRKAWEIRRLTFVPPIKGKKMSEASRVLMSDSAKRHPSNRIGKKHSLETRALISQKTRERTPHGSACHSYKDGKLAERRDERFSAKYKRWRFDVFMRDKFACRHCKDDRGGNLVAHHIKEFAEFPDLRFEIDNGITLCRKCHKKVHAKR